MPFSSSEVSFVKVRVVAGNIRTASPALRKRIGMLMMITFVELCVEAERGQVAYMPFLDGRC
jgi:hypothetical protein